MTSPSGLDAPLVMSVAVGGTCTPGSTGTGVISGGTFLYGTGDPNPTTGTGSGGGITGASGKIIGDAAPGQNATPGGGDRALAASGGADAEDLCLKVLLPLNTAGTPSTGFQNAMSRLTLTFSAEQTKNNP